MRFVYKIPPRIPDKTALGKFHQKVANKNINNIQLHKTE